MKIFTTLLVMALPLLQTPYASANQSEEAGSDVPVVVVEKSQTESPDFDLKGSVKLEYTLMPDGSIRDIVVVESDPPGAWDKKAIEQLKKWKHEPGSEPETKEMTSVFFHLDEQ